MSALTHNKSSRRMNLSHQRQPRTPSDMQVFERNGGFKWTRRQPTAERSKVGIASLFPSRHSSPDGSDTFGGIWRSRNAKFCQGQYGLFNSFSSSTLTRRWPSKIHGNRWQRFPRMSRLFADSGSAPPPAPKLAEHPCNAPKDGAKRSVGEASPSLSGPLLAAAGGSPAPFRHTGAPTPQVSEPANPPARVRRRLQYRYCPT